MHISDHCTPPPLASLPPTGRESGGKGKGVGGGKSKFVSDDSMKEYRRLQKAAQRAEAAGEADAGVKRAAFRNWTDNMDGGVNPGARDDDEEDEEEEEEES